MPTVETIMNRGFSNGQPWDRTPLRKAVMLLVLPLAALVIAVAGAAIIYDDVTADYPVGYVVSSSEDCTLVVAERPDGPPVATVQQSSGGRLGTCGGLDENQEVYYDLGRGVQAFGPDNNVVGMVVLPVVVLLVAVPGALAWTHTLQKRRARGRSAA
ncbi:hypothetical protein ENKNEFLB_03416 [Nocardioides aquaticus]|uniref:Uncharacterized protein n=1 Tax=Nocardioides aquaticus TaxID=160826 RepID=A0ABX8EKG0_9ACTN|nr:hypothetical protein [Nocardioides aquaticus]QVT81013.1 hypothetical protein ENKNEFLB_03416 [Nocardioides aquaticus]